MSRSEAPSLPCPRPVAPGPRPGGATATGAGSGGYRIAGLPAGRRGKYAVLAGWLAIVAACGGYSAGAVSGTGSAPVYATLAVIIVAPLLAWRSPVLWLLPVITAGAALTSAEAVISLLARHAGMTVSAQGSGVLTVLVLGTCAGYALLLIGRYREELRRHADRYEAMAVALRRAGPAIVATAATAMAGMLCLIAADGSAGDLGVVAATGIAIGLLTVITLLPALLVLSSGWMAWPRRAGLPLATRVRRKTMHNGPRRRPRALLAPARWGITPARAALTGTLVPCQLAGRRDRAASEASGNVRVPVA